jgi:cell division protein FtsL
MKKFFVISLIIFLILFTAIIKNSTKRIDDKIFTIKENIRGFKKDFENIKLEHDYLSSAEKLLEFQIIYFENELTKKDIRNIKIINENMGNFKIEQFKFANEK